MSDGLSDEEQARIILRGLPGMTSEAERRAIYRVALEMESVGQAVDLGCWLGSLTIPMVLGLQHNPYLRDVEARIHAYDSFVWQASYMDSHWPESLPTSRPNDGESFLEAFEYMVAPWADSLEIHCGDLTHSRWTGGPIELLSVDAMKSPALSQKIISEFYSSLVPGKSILFHQDYCHGYTWWIHIHQFLLRDHFGVVDTLEGSAGILFRFLHALGAGDLVRVSQADLSDEALASDAFLYSLSLVAPADRGTIAAAWVRCELAAGRARRAHELMERHADDSIFARELSGLPEWTRLQPIHERTQS